MAAIVRLTIIFITLVMFSASCNEKVFTGDVNCNDCYTDKPDNADLVIDLSVNGQYPRVPFVIYKGDMEQKDIVAIDTAYSSPFYVNVSVGTLYSIRAEYKKGNKTVYAVDGTKIKVLLVTGACDKDCYVIENTNLDVRLKSEFQ